MALAAMKPDLLPALETELAEIRKDARRSVGLGDKAYAPYVPNVARSLISVDDPAVTQRLVAEVRGSADRIYQLAVLHVLGRRVDPTVDAALIELLAEPALRATAAYLLGAVGGKGLPKRARDAATLHAVRAALLPWIDDTARFDDPFLEHAYTTGDFALCAFVRVVGPARFKLRKEQADLIGFALPELDAATRTALQAQARAIH